MIQKTLLGLMACCCIMSCTPQDNAANGPSNVFTSDSSGSLEGYWRYINEDDAFIKIQNDTFISEDIFTIELEHFSTVNEDKVGHLKFMLDTIVDGEVGLSLVGQDSLILVDSLRGKKIVYQRSSCLHQQHQQNNSALSNELLRHIQGCWHNITLPFPSVNMEIWTDTVSMSFIHNFTITDSLKEGKKTRFITIKANEINQVTYEVFLDKDTLSLLLGPNLRGLTYVRCCKYRE